MDETNELPDPTGAWTAAQRAIAEKLARKHHEIYDRLASKHYVAGYETTQWDDFTEIERELFVQAAWELLFGDQGGELVGTTGFPG